jgi:transposase
VKPIREEIKRLLEEGANYDVATGEKTPLAKTMGTCRKMLTVETAFWTFVEREGVEPTNNAAERALRPAVLWRKHSFGSNSKAGSRFVARMMTTVTTLKAQQRSPLDFLAQALKASRKGLPKPSLILTIGSTH